MAGAFDHAGETRRGTQRPFFYFTCNSALYAAIHWTGYTGSGREVTASAHGSGWQATVDAQTAECSHHEILIYFVTFKSIPLDRKKGIKKKFVCDLEDRKGVSNIV